MNLSRIKLVCFDCDGVLTDGIYQISEDPALEVTKSFYTKDFYAIQKLLENDITVFIVTQSHDKVINRQILRICSHSKIWSDAFKSGSLKVLTGIENKKEAIHAEILKKNEWGWHNVAYMGDAENDISSMKKALFTGCPADAIEEVKENANYISDHNGGHGAVHDFCMSFLKKRNEEK